MTTLLHLDSRAVEDLVALAAFAAECALLAAWWKGRRA